MASGTTNSCGTFCSYGVPNNGQITVDCDPGSVIFTCRDGISQKGVFMIDQVGTVVLMANSAGYAQLSYNTSTLQLTIKNTGSGYFLATVFHSCRIV